MALREYECKICGKNLPTRAGALRHVSLSHKGNANDFRVRTYVLRGYPLAGARLEEIF